MSEEIKTTEETTSDETQKAVESAQLEERKKFDRQYSELSKTRKELETLREQNEKLLLDGKSAKEIAEHNRIKEREDFNKKVAEFEHNKLELFKLNSITENKIPVEFKNFINGKSEDQITANIIKLKAVFDKQVQLEIESKLKNYNKKPETSGEQKQEDDPFSKLPAN